MLCKWQVKKLCISHTVIHQGLLEGAVQALKSLPNAVIFPDWSYRSHPLSFCYHTSSVHFSPSPSSPFSTLSLSLHHTRVCFSTWPQSVDISTLHPLLCWYDDHLTVKSKGWWEIRASSEAATAAAEQLCFLQTKCSALMKSLITVERSRMLGQVQEMHVTHLSCFPEWRGEAQYTDGEATSVRRVRAL